MSTRTDMADELAHWPIGSGYYATAVDTDTAREMAAAVLALLAERGMVVLGTDREPLDVRPLLVQLALVGECHAGGARGYLLAQGIDIELADACLAAAEVEP